MTERKFLYLSSEGYHQEHDTTADELTIAGLTMAGAIDMGSSNKVTNLASATSSGDALAYGQSGASLTGLTVTTTDLTMSGGATVTGLPTPTADSEAAPKSYVDGVAAGLDWKESVRVATVTSGTFPDDFVNGQVVDTVTLVTGDRILIKDQGSSVNGIYIVPASGTPSRADDMAVGDAAAGNAVFIEEGSQADTGWVCTNNGGSDVVNTHTLVFTQFTGLGQITAGNGLTKTGSTLNVGAGNGISVAADSVAVNPDTTSTTTTEANAIAVGANGVSVKVDDSTIEGSTQGAGGAESLRLKAGGITGSHLASNISITSTGSITLNNPGALSVYGGITSTNGVFTGNGSGLTNLPAAASTDAVTASARTASGTITKGTPVCVTGYNGTEDCLVVTTADADSGNMPAYGVAATSISDTVTGSVIVTGLLEDVDTSGTTVGDCLYVSTSGTLTKDRPTGATSVVQVMGTVVVVDGSVGKIGVCRADPFNEGNITQHYLWIGDSDAHPLATPVGNGLTDTPGATLAVDPYSGATASVEPVTVTADGVGLDISDIAGTGLEHDGSANLRIAAAAAGDGLTGGAGSALAVNVSSTGGIEIDTDAVVLKVYSTGGLQTDSNGASIKIDDTPDTLDVDGDGLKVVGLPAQFKIDGTAVGATVTKANLDALTNGSNADSLHVHTAGSPTITETVTVNEAISIGNVLAWSTGTSDRVAKASASTDALARVVGVAKTAQATPGNSCEMVSLGALDGVLSSATLGAPIYLSSTGTLTETIPSGGDRIILVGYAQTASNLWVAIRDYGKSAS